MMMMVMKIYAICHSTALLSDFSTHSSNREALKTNSGFMSKGFNTQDTHSGTQETPDPRPPSPIFRVCEINLQKHSDQTPSKRTVALKFLLTPADVSQVWVDFGLWSFWILTVIVFHL